MRPDLFSAGAPPGFPHPLGLPHHPHLSPHHHHHLGIGIGVGHGKRKKSWTRAVFSHLQRKGLEKRFQIQKYITKPDRRLLAASLGLTDAQVGKNSTIYYLFLSKCCSQFCQEYTSFNRLEHTKLLEIYQIVNHRLINYFSDLK